MRNTVQLVVWLNLCTAILELQNDMNFDITLDIQRFLIAFLPFVHIAIPLSIMYDSNAIIIPNNAKYTQSSPIRANECDHTHDNAFIKRFVCLPNSS